MLCFSIVLSLRRLAKVGPKNGSCEGSAVQDVDKICTTPARESDLEVKITKASLLAGVCFPLGMYWGQSF